MQKVVSYADDPLVPLPPSFLLEELLPLLLSNAAPYRGGELAGEGQPFGQRVQAFLAAYLTSLHREGGEGAAASFVEAMLGKAVEIVPKGLPTVHLLSSLPIASAAGSLDVRGLGRMVEVLRHAARSYPRWCNEVVLHLLPPLPSSSPRAPSPLYPLPNPPTAPSPHNRLSSIA